MAQLDGVDSSQVTIAVAVVEDDFLGREGIRRLLDAEPTITVVGAYADPASFFDGLEDNVPNVVITDIRMPPSWADEGLELARRLHASNPTVGVVALSQVSSPDYAAKLFADGAERRAYVLKDRVADHEGIVHVIREVAAGGSYVDPEVVVALVAAHADTLSPLRQLTERELEVLALLAEGLSNTAIAERLVLSKRSVEGHVNSIFQKLELPDERRVSRRVAAALLFLSTAR